MLSRFQILGLSVLVAGFMVSSASARTWKDATGKYSMQGDLLAYNDHEVILKKSDKKLISVEIAQLSAEDQEYLKSKQALEDQRPEAARVQTWTMASGLKVLGKIVDFGIKEVVVQRRRGKVYVNERPFSNLTAVQQRIVVRTISHFENVPLETEKDVEGWLMKKGGKEQHFRTEGVVLELENGDEHTVPLFLFSEKDREFLQPGWDRWKQFQDDEREREHERLVLEAQSRAYQAEQQRSEQVTRVQLGLLATAAGVIDLWEVGLIPKPGVRAYAMSVVVPGRTSDDAARVALTRYPMYQIGAIRQVNR